MDAAKRGAAALDAGNCAEAIKEYTSALKQMPKAVDYFLKRSSAYQRSSPPDLAAALKDAETGLHYAFERAKRELIGQAQLRRATIMYNMGQYGNTQYLLEFVKKFDEKNKTTAIWESKVATKLKALPEDDESRKVTAVERPKVDLSEDKPEAKAISSSAVTSTPDAPKKPVQTPASQIKHDWYQNKDNIYFSLLAKGVPQDKATIDIEEHSVSLAPVQCFKHFKLMHADIDILPNISWLRLQLHPRPPLRRHRHISFHITDHTHKGRAHTEEEGTRSSMEDSRRCRSAHQTHQQQRRFYL
jgi:suppressor of G2 allele of SKP1